MQRKIGGILSSGLLAALIGGHAYNKYKQQRMATDPAFAADEGMEAVTRREAKRLAESDPRPGLQHGDSLRNKKWDFSGNNKVGNITADILLRNKHHKEYTKALIAEYEASKAYMSAEELLNRERRIEQGILSNRRKEWE